MNTVEILANKLLNIRQEVNMSIKQVSDILEISESEYSEHEQGLKDYGDNYLNAIMYRYMMLKILSEVEDND